jgi:glycosyltransferase involved in cell wall biosynthesis
MKTNPRLLRITTVPISLKLLLRGQLSYFKQNGFEVLAVSAKGPEIKSIEEEGIQHRVVGMTRQITPVRDLVALVRLIILIRSFRPDIVHTHTPKAGLLGMWAAKICGVPVRMHTVAGLPLMEATGLKRRLLKLTESVTYACAHKIYPNSYGLMKYICQNFTIHPPKIKVLGQGSTNGIDIRYFAKSPELLSQAQEIRRRYKIPESAVVYCFVGRIVRDKGINELIKAFAMLTKQVQQYLLLVGPFENDLDPVSEETLTCIRENSAIISTGYQSDVRPFLAASDIFVFPSYREGFPNVVLQACALQIPCIVSDINGCNEIVTHEVTGLIVPSKDEGALAHAMKVMADNPEKRKEFEKQALLHITRNFDHAVMMKLLHNEYLDLLSANVERR